MTIRYVGPGGSDANSGLSWTLRKLTLNGVEDSPVAAGDTVHVGPGTYRELLTVDVSGTAGNPITYIGDYSGANTDGVGGEVRITGAANETTTGARTNCISATSKDYRTFRGFRMDGASSFVVVLASCQNCILDQCAFLASHFLSYQIAITGASQLSNSITRCLFDGWTNVFGHVYFTHSSLVSNSGHVVENCVVLRSNNRSITFENVGGGVIRNCLLMGCSSTAVRATGQVAGGQFTLIENNVFWCNSIPITIGSAGDAVYNYNVFSGNGSVPAGGTGNVTYPWNPDMRWFFEMVGGGRLATALDIASYSALVNLAGTSPPTTDARGAAVIGSDRERGPLEYDPTLLLRSAGGLLRHPGMTGGVNG